MDNMPETIVSEDKNILKACIRRILETQFPDAVTPPSAQEESVITEGDKPVIDVALAHVMLPKPGSSGTSKSQ